MIFYHGSYTEIKHPSIEYSREDIDFGAGFYLTQDKGMAEKWASAKKNSIVSAFTVDLDMISKFEFQLDKSWLEFVKNNRLLQQPATQLSGFDMLIGPTADDKLFATLDEYLNGYITANEAVQFLNVAGYSKQYVFKNQDALDKYCRFVKSYEITGSQKQTIRDTVLADRIEINQKLSELKKIAKMRRE